MQKPVLRLAVEYLPLRSLHPWSGNARTHSKRQIQQIAGSIREFGFTNPILIDRKSTVVAGHGRIEAAKLLGISKVPTIRLEHLSDEQKRAYIIADNRLAEKAGWDREILAIELQHLSALELDFELEITGFETAEIDLLMDGATTGKKDPADATPPIESTIVSRTSDIWRLGEHRLLCGDARDYVACEILFEHERACLVFADPPFNVRIQGHAGGLGAIKHREFAMASGEMTPQHFVEFLHAVFANAARLSLDGAIHYICMDWRHIEELLTATKTLYSEFKNLCVWNKDNGGMGSLYRSKHELVFVFKVGTGPHVNNIDLGRTGRYRTNVWDYAGVNTLRTDRLQDLAMHPTVKPVALVVDAIRDCSRRKDIIFDPFAGSGTTIIAAEKSGRRARAIEIDPAYVDVAVRRWQTLTGGTAIHAVSGKTFVDVAEERLNEGNPGSQQLGKESVK
jgi:DNA modification methylase